MLVFSELVFNPPRCLKPQTMLCHGQENSVWPEGEMGQGLSREGAEFGVKSLFQGLNQLHLGLNPRIWD